MDNETKKLLKQGLLKIPSKDFSDRTMERIHADLKEKPQIQKDIRLSWIFLGISIVLLPLGLIFVINTLQLLEPYLIKLVSKEVIHVSLQLVPLLSGTIISLIQLDNLIQLTRVYKQEYLGSG
jgi:hypothetical protein